jgi:hypothetical protein
MPRASSRHSGRGGYGTWRMPSPNVLAQEDVRMERLMTAPGVGPSLRLVSWRLWR